MRKRLLLLLGCSVAVVAAVFFLWPVDRITREAFSMIRPGMTVAQVQEALGLPSDGYPKNATIMFEGVPLSRADPQSYPREKLRLWVGSEHAILVELDAHDLIAHAYFGHLNRFRPSSLKGWLRRWLGF